MAIGSAAVVSDFLLSGISKEEFDADKQDAFISVMAVELGIDSRYITIVLIEEVEARRLQSLVPSIKITLRVDCATEQANKLGMDLIDLFSKESSGLSSKLAQAGLLVSITQWSSPIIANKAGIQRLSKNETQLRPLRTDEFNSADEEMVPIAAVAAGAVGLIVIAISVVACTSSWSRRPLNKVHTIDASLSQRHRHSPSPIRLASQTLMPMDISGSSTRDISSATTEPSTATAASSKQQIAIDADIIKQLDMEASVRKSFKTAVRTVQAMNALKRSIPRAEEEKTGD
jgi:hypothetical protein